MDNSWLVFISLENDHHDRCIDLFERPDGTCGFEEFRRDAEDAGAWTPVSYFSERSLPGRRAALLAAIASVPWLGAAVEAHRSALDLLKSDACPPAGPPPDGAKHPPLRA